MRQPGVRDTSGRPGTPVVGLPLPVTGPVAGVVDWSVADGFEEFAGARGAALVRSARALLRDPQHAEDVVQEVLVKAHRHWDHIVRQEVPEAYVRRMLVNACVSYRRRGWWRETSVADHDLPAVADLRAVTDDAVADRELVLGLLRRLPAKQRAALVLRHYEGLPDADVARLLGSSVQTVRSNVHRGLAALRRMMLEVEESAS